MVYPQHGGFPTLDHGVRNGDWVDDCLMVKNICPEIVDISLLVVISGNPLRVISIVCYEPLNYMTIIHHSHMIKQHYIHVAHHQFTIVHT